MHRTTLVGLVVLVVVVIVARAGVASACINLYGTNVEGHRIEYGVRAEDYLAPLTEHRTHDERAAAPLGPAPAADADFKVRSDYAAALLYHGQAAAAVALLEDVERAHPGEAAVASNLGTAYELAGDDTRALQWIREGIRRNPADHLGSEWLHVRILEAKLALAADPTWLATHSVLGVDFGTADVPLRPTTWPPGQDEHSTRDALWYQLGERLGFVRTPDPIVADLIADLGNLIARDMPVGHTARVYDLALTYHPVHADLIARRRAYLDTVPSAGQPLPIWVYPIAALVAVLAVVGLLLARRHRRRARA